MARPIAKKYLDAHQRVKDNIEDAQEYFSSNVRRYEQCKEFVFKSTLSESDRSILGMQQLPELEFNVLEAYISRLRGEFSKQEPSFSVRALNDQSDPQTVEAVEGILRGIMLDANNDQFESKIYTNQLAGGFSVMKLWTEYEHDKTFDQKIRLGQVYDPTLCGFDPMARMSHKGDGQFCYELFPKTKEEFEKDYPDVDISSVSYTRQGDGFSWTYQQNQTDILMLCDYYEKKKIRYKLLMLSNGQTVTKDEFDQIEIEIQEQIMLGNVGAVMPVVVNTRWTEEYIICRYRLIGDQVIDYIELKDFTYLPLIFVDGNSALIRNEQVTRPYVYNAMDAQRLKNFAGISLANELENVEQHQWLAPAEGIPIEQKDPWTSPNQPGVLLYNPKDSEGNPLPPPNPIPRQPIPAEIPATFAQADTSIQNILGSYDASLGINNNQLSGVAIVEGATQSNAAAMPYIMNFLAALNQAAQIILDMLPKYYVTPRTVPVVDSKGRRSYQMINQPSVENSVNIDYPQNTLEVSVEPGVNFEVQKNRAMQTITQLMGASEGFNAMMNQGGLPILCKNLSIKGSSELVELAEQFTEQQQQQQQAAQAQAQQGNNNNPEMMKLSLQQQQVQQSQQRIEMENQYKTAEIQLKNAQLSLKQEQIRNDRLQLLLTEKETDQDNAVQLTKAQTERLSNLANLELKHQDQVHRHSMDHINNHQEQ